MSPLGLIPSVVKMKSDMTDICLLSQQDKLSGGFLFVLFRGPRLTLCFGVASGSADTGRETWRAGARPVPPVALGFVFVFVNLIKHFSFNGYISIGNCLELCLCAFKVVSMFLTCL